MISPNRAFWASFRGLRVPEVLIQIDQLTFELDSLPSKHSTHSVVAAEMDSARKCAESVDYPVGWQVTFGQCCKRLSYHSGRAFHSEHFGDGTVGRHLSEWDLFNDLINPSVEAGLLAFCTRRLEACFECLGKMFIDRTSFLHNIWIRKQK